MQISIIGAGFIGSTLGARLSAAGFEVTFGVRRPDETNLEVPTATVATVAEAIAAAEVLVLAIPGGAVADFVATHGLALEGKLIIDATNQMGAEVPNARAVLPAGVRYARAFNTLGGENFADPTFDGAPADLFFSAPGADEATVAAVIAGVGLRPIFVGEDREDLIDALFKLWIALALTQGRGRKLALRLLEG